MIFNSRKLRKVIFILLLSLLIAGTIVIVSDMMSVRHIAYAPQRERSSSVDKYIDDEADEHADHNAHAHHVDEEVLHLEELRRTLYNLSPIYTDRTIKTPNEFNRTCAKFPTVYQLYFSNTYYQTLESSNGTFHLYGAYLDTRKANPDVWSTRILAMIDRMDANVTTYCQLWYRDKSKPVLIKSTETRLIWNKAFGVMKLKAFYSYLVSCPMSAQYRKDVPLSVSLVEKQCDMSTNNLKLNYDVPEAKEKFAVCVKGLDFPTTDNSARLIEWIEALHLVGASKVFIYNLNSHPNIVKAMQYYQRRDFVELVNITMPGYQPNLKLLQHFYMKKRGGNKRQNELVPYNDCFYRNMYKYEYIVVLDTDEFIVPTQDWDWHAVLDRVFKRLGKAGVKRLDTSASFAAQNVYFLDVLSANVSEVAATDMKQQYHMLQHVHRTHNFSNPGSYNKCFHNTEQVMTLHNHFAFSCLTKHCEAHHINTDEAQLNHYRGDCYNNLSSCRQMKEDRVKDTVMWRYKERLMMSVDRVMDELGFA